MAIDLHSDDGAAIRRLTPFITLPGAYFETLCDEITVQYAKQGVVLFMQGEETSDLFYLLAGDVALKSDEFEVEAISANSCTARFALAHQIPRKIDAVAKNDIRYIRIAAELIKQPPAEDFDGESSFMITDEIDENDGDWMTQLLKSPVFQRLPAANLQKILMGFQEISFNKGELIVAQDQPADYYFIIKSGQCVLTRKPTPNAKEITLAKLGVNDSFGEDAIISGKFRNVSVTALTEMTLLRMEKQRFVSLIKDEILRFISYQEMQQPIAKNILILDVRSPDDYNSRHLENSINIPLFSLRMQLKALHRKKTIIVVCQDGRESSTAAFLLIKNKLDAVVLEGGIDALPEENISKTAVFEIDDGGQEILLDQQPEVSELILDQSEPVVEGDEEGNQFVAEIEELKRENQQLTANYSNLLQEKQHLEKDYRILAKQNDKLKAVLNKLKGGNPKVAAVE